MLEAIYHSLLVFYLAYGHFIHSDVGLWQFGTLVCFQSVLVILVQMAVEVRTWTVLHIASVLLSLMLYLSCGLLLSSFPRAPAFLMLHRSLSSPDHYSQLS